VTTTTAKVFESVEELLGQVDLREPFVPEGMRSTALFERVRRGEERLVLKYLHADHDFAMRAYGDLGARTVLAYEAGLFDAAADVIDHGVVGMARGVGRNGWGCAVLMRDVSGDLASTDDTPFGTEEHDRLLDHLARMCASTWGWRDDVGLLPYATRWTFTSESMLEGERAAASTERVVPIVEQGVARFLERAPADVASGVEALRRDVFPLTDALAATPSCFLHGDWKASNIGGAADGRTVLIDWVYLGEGPACHELGWYLALNRRKLPTTKEQAIDDFRGALERHGVDTTGWWDRQLRLALLGTVVQFGWEKALGDDDELAWWCDRARDGLACL
jgi:hypothetical protein